MPAILHIEGRRTGAGPCSALALGLFAWALLPAATRGAVLAPVPKWHNGGCFASWCQTGWYASPAVADLDGDTIQEVIWGSYDLVSLRGTDGGLEWRQSNPERVWPGIVVADLTGDGTLEVAVGRNGNQLVLHDRFGMEIWTRNPFSGGEVRTLVAADLENDGILELLPARAASGGTLQVSVYNPAGVVRPGWPARRVGEPGFGAGMYNQNLAVADLDGDNAAEVYAPTDTHYISAFHPNGNQLPAHPMYGAGEVWSQVGVHVDHSVDLIGFANCGVEHRPNFANGAPSVGDLDGDGTLELVVPGDVYDCAIGDNEQGDLYYSAWVLRRDRTRWAAGGFDWTVIPNPGAGSGPLSEDYDVIENSVSNAVLADLDGDGRREILYSSYDGKVHAWWLDKTERESWPYDVPGSGIRFAGEPVVADLDNDGKAEVIFTSWPEKAPGGQEGSLHVLDWRGVALHTLPLPPALAGGSEWNGGLAAPTIANLDGDADLELVAGTASSGVVAWDLPGSAAARVLWGTGRGNQRRDGVAPPNLPPPDNIFGDGFEGGDLTAWTATQGGPGDLAATAAAALNGSDFGLAVNVDDTEQLYVQDSTPNAESRYRLRFWLDPNGYLTGADGQRTKIVQALGGNPSRRILSVVLRRAGGQYEIAAKAHRDDDSWANSGLIPLSDAPHAIEVNWRRAAGAGIADGRLELWIDGISVATVNGVDNDLAVVDQVRMGVFGVKPGAAGTLYLDAFRSRRLSYIAP